MGYFWKDDVINKRSRDKLIDGFNLLFKYAEKYSVDTRTAAYMLAIDRVAYATRLRGFHA
jgi:glutamate dehydrogenase (NAD(P)+)